MQPSSPENTQPRKRRRVGNPFLDLEAAADEEEDEDEDEDEEEEIIGDDGDVEGM